jgi:hypothetical protein
MSRTNRDKEVGKQGKRRQKRGEKRRAKGG